MINPLKLKLHWQILIALVLAIPSGLFLSSGSLDLTQIFSFLGTLFINALKMLVVPLVLLAIIDGLLGLDNEPHFGRLGFKTLVYYTCTSLFAILVGLILVNIIQPGIINGQAARDVIGLSELPAKTASAVSGKGSSDLWGVFLRMVPTNIFKAAANGQVLGLITFGFLFGLFALKLSDEDRQPIAKLVSSLNKTFMAITEGVMKLAPIGIWGLVSLTISRTGFDSIKPLALFAICVLLGLIIHAFFTLSIALKAVGINPKDHLKGMGSVLLTAFSTSSSAATIPRTLESLEKNAGVSKRVRGFTIPLGATVNMDGTALYECVAALFIAQAYGLELSFGVQFTVVLVALLSSIGVAAIPSASLVAIVLILQTIGLPLEALGLILASDRILDMFRTSVNVYSDSVGAVLIAKLEGETPYAK
jgi:proton glutamate symport protein